MNILCKGRPILDTNQHDPPTLISYLDGMPSSPLGGWIIAVENTNINPSFRHITWVESWRASWHRMFARLFITIVT